MSAAGLAANRSAVDYRQRQAESTLLTQREACLVSAIFGRGRRRQPAAGRGAGLGTALS